MWLIKHQYTSQAPDSPTSAAASEPEHFTVPAQGGAFDFTATAHCTGVTAGWRIGLRRDGVGEVERMLETVRLAVRETARRFPVFEAARAEEAANRNVSDRLAEMAAEPDGPRTWTVRVELRPPDEVLDAMRESALDRYRIEAKAEADALRLKKTDDLRVRWQRFLEESAANPTARYAVRLTQEPHQAAETLGTLQKERRESAEELLEHVTRLAEALQSADILGLVVNSETVLRKTLALMGVRMAPIDDDSPLVPADETV
ncbi:hypothetical protein [Actinomadura sp. WMMA1423]|uniref:hypothetical protein n=1 Tax=Actinomadura sp. WMMA1423 TaxID=2591108 RepID=UPI001146829B|nr:hypothetical protein [Actinomadura sp. WMMA1423]